MTAKELKKGETAVITGFAGRTESIQRLRELGLTRGTEISCAGTAPFGDPIRLFLRGSELSLRREDAARIRVDRSRRGAALSDDPRRESDPAEEPLFPNPLPEAGLGAVLVGNPNCGKTTVFNRLTGSRQSVGNWPGVTVEKKQGWLPTPNGPISLTDLPGLYSLSAGTAEEAVAAGYLARRASSAVVDLADSTNLERHLYLTLQLIEQNLPLILALNMSDEAEKQQIRVSAERLAERLGIPVLSISGKTSRGLSRLAAEIDAVNSCPRGPRLSRLRWRRTPEGRYAYIRELLAECIVRAGPPVKTEKAFRPDRIFMHKRWGIPLFLGIMLLIFFTVFGPPGRLLQQGVRFFFEEILAKGLVLLLQKAGAPRWAESLLVQGVLGGVGGVLSFLPQIALLFFLLSLLEDSGYMARIAFLTDRTLRRFGLSGKAFIPMLMGFGCTVPAVQAARTIENGKDRQMTILLIPFLSCSAKLPIYVFLADAFFGERRVLIVFSLYLLGIFMAALSGAVFRKTLFRGQTAGFLMELPPYRMPMLGDVLRRVRDRSSHFLKKAATLILVMSILLWFLQSFDSSLQLVSDPGKSLLARAGNVLAPFFRPLGFGSWQAVVALLAGLAAKESVVACLSLFYGAEISRAFCCPAAAYAFLVFVLLYTPCAAASASMNRELGSSRLTAAGLLLQTGYAYLLSFLVYTVGRLF